MRMDWWTLSLQTVNAIVLIWLLAYFFFRPIANVIAARKAAAAQMIEEAGQAKAAALSMREEEKAALAAAAERRSAALAAAAEEAEAQREALLAAARSDVDRMRDEARGEMTRQLELARDMQTKHASALALDIAKRLMERFPQSSLVSGFIAGLADAAAALPENSKLDFEEDGGVRLKTPRALTPQEHADCRRALEISFGRPLEFSVEINPALIAGLELENRHTTIRNSLRADLADIAASLDDHDRG
ncbi:F0F1 ATP synthase subunit B [Methylocystis sp. JAN1]|uniref:F0F1 ATP synthase subunit B family protein n=1 Tax=Methylocystis sp. JAN1 TaxID=3397211 RepID=UPI003FA27DCD